MTSAAGGFCETPRAEEFHEMPRREMPTMVRPDIHVESPYLVQPGGVLNVPGGIIQVAFRPTIKDSLSQGIAQGLTEVVAKALEGIILNSLPTLIEKAWNYRANAREEDGLKAIVAMYAPDGGGVGTDPKIRQLVIEALAKLYKEKDPLCQFHMARFSECTHKAWGISLDPFQRVFQNAAAVRKAATARNIPEKSDQTARMP